MHVLITEDLNATPASPYRFCAGVTNDRDPDRGGFGATERAALADLATQYGMSADTLLAAASVERAGVR